MGMSVSRMYSIQSYRVRSYVSEVEAVAETFKEDDTLWNSDDATEVKFFDPPKEYQIII